MRSVARQADATNQDWHPRALAAGLRWTAIVSPRAAVARLSLKQIITTIGSVEVVTNHFDDMKLARAWLSALTRPS